jgi:hypothetical protein
LLIVCCHPAWRTSSLSRSKTSAGRASGGWSEAAADCDQDCQEEDPARNASLDRPTTGRRLVGHRTEPRLTRCPTAGRPGLRANRPPWWPMESGRRLLAPAVTGLSENCPKTVRKLSENWSRRVPTQSNEGGGGRAIFCGVSCSGLTGVAANVASHNPKVAGSNPAPATRKLNGLRHAP